MKNKINYIYILLFLIIIFSFTIPRIITRLQDKKILSNNYTINEEIHTLSESKNQTKLIKAIYSKYNTNKYEVCVSDTFEAAEVVIQEIRGSIQTRDDISILNNINELVENNIITSNFYEQFSSEYIIFRRWNYDNGEIKYSKLKIFTSNDYENAIASIEVEDETNKIIAFKIKKEYVLDNQNCLQEYIKYLGLDKEFTDWKYKNDELSSKVAGIKITVINDGQNISFNIQPLK